MSKPRLRFSSKGWLYHAFTMVTGRKSMATGIVYPDEYGAYEREFWVGPFTSAPEAYAARSRWVALNG